ncbi:MAG: hypothetical protein JKY87_00240 [Mariprofundus sp.]|nr:hypothetical protein [Mariprofundus sp.]
MAKPVAFSFKQTPEAAKAYLKGKGFKLTFNYDEMIGKAHHTAFTVAKVTRVDLLNDIFTSLNEAMASGETFKDWQARIKPTLQKKGWYGLKEVVNPKTGEIKEVYIGSRRLRNIFNTNMRVAHSVARFKQAKALIISVYWRYSSVLIPNTRDSHAAIHGTILHKDDAFWNSNYPPNDWGCKCKVRAYSKKQLEKRGMAISAKSPKSVAGKDWAHDVGAGSRVGALTKIKLGTGLKTIVPNKALDNLSDEQLKGRFYKTLGIQPGQPYIDKIGDPMDIDDGLFTKFKGGASKIRKNDRHLYIDELAKTIADPDEIYLEVESRTGKAKLVKKMFRYFKDEKGDKKAFMALFTYEKDKTIGTSIYVIKPDVITKKRVEKLIYQKTKGD